MMWVAIPTLLFVGWTAAEIAVFVAEAGHYRWGWVWLTAAWLCFAATAVIGSYSLWELAR